MRAYSSNRTCSQSSRLRLLRSTCKAKKHDTITSVAPKRSRKQINAYVDEKHKIFACLPPKSGCTTWKTILANNSFDEPFQLKDVMQIHILAITGQIPGAVHFQQLSPEKKDEVLNSKEYFRFMVARHPLERIYSAYKDKIVGGGTFCRQVLKMVRKNITKEKSKSCDGVTFREFVQFLQSRRPKDPHFAPINNDFFPCFIKYDYIVKTESMDVDNEYIIDRFLGPTKRGMGTVKNVFVGNEVSKDWSSLLSPKGRLLEAYKTLTAEDVAFLVDWFKEDFLHFGYDWRVENNTGKAAVYSLCRTKGGKGKGKGKDLCC